MSKVLVPAAIGGGLRGVQTDWDIKEMLKGAGYGALAGYGMDRLKALWDYATSPDTSGPGSFSDVLKENPDAELGDWAKDFTSTHGKFAATSPITDSARQQLTAAELYNMPTVGTDEFAGNLGYGFGGRSYDATLIPDQYVGPWQHGREDYFVGEWQTHGIRVMLRWSFTMKTECGKITSGRNPKRIGGYTKTRMIRDSALTIIPPKIGGKGISNTGTQTKTLFIMP